MRRELRWFAALIPLLGRQLDAEWSSRVYVTDASFWGRGVCVGNREPEKVAEAGRINERWRFRRDVEAEVALGHHLGGSEADVGTERFSISSPGVAGVEGSSAGGGYKPIEEEMHAGPWRTVSAGRWQREETMPILEGRSLVWALRHRLRNSASFGQRCLFLTDSLTQALALSKGRSPSSPMNGICR